MLALKLEPLPVDAHLDQVRAHLARRRAVIVSAAPGAGKTTRIAPAVVERGPVILLQPRRVAARAVARRIADERQWTLGREVGWQIRFERRFTHDTRLLVVTEGILTARLQHDPLLSEFATVIFDEFHERSIHADIGLALARQAWLARDDLHLIVMSATLDVAPVSTFLSDCPVIQVPGQLHPMTIEYAAGETVANALNNVTPRTPGNILCFLPGAREIGRAQSELSALAQAADVDVVALHGSLDSDAQDQALRPGARRRVILATNIAETSLTVPGVSAVIDTGLHKVARYDGARAIDSLTLERVAEDSANQRAGRAARLGPGLVRRLWDARQRLHPHREPEIARVDLAAAVLDVLVWGAELDNFEWFEAPSVERVSSALGLLTRLGAVEGRAITPLGRQLQQIPVHPRLARILIEGRAAPEVVAACARLSEGISLKEPLGALSPHVGRTAQQLRQLVTTVIDTVPSARADPHDLARALFAGYADRLGRRRREEPARAVLASGHGAVLGREVGDIPGEFFVALDVIAAEHAGAAEARVRAASPVEPHWIVPTASDLVHRFDRATGRVRAARVERYDALILREHPVAADAATAAGILAKAWLERGPDASANRLLGRARFAGRDLDVAALVDSAAVGASSIDAIDLDAHLPFDVTRALAVEAPETLLLPSGRTTRVEYANDGSVSVSVKLQELFGLAETPRLGLRRVPVTMHLLAPNGRPVQTTSDLRSFWDRTYPEVRKELRGRYPKHPWPEDPWTAIPTHRTKRRV